MIKQLINFINIDTIICLVGLTLFSTWLIRTSLGRNALSGSIARKIPTWRRPGDSMPVYLPFIPLLFWLGTVALAVSVVKHFAPDLADWQAAFVNNLIFCITAILTSIVIIFLVWSNFTERLKGFGLKIETIHKDFFAGLLNLLAVWPIVIAAIIITTHIGKLLFGQDFEIQPHQELQLIATHSQLSLRILIIITAAVVIPVFEEMLFRGLFQTMIRSYIEARRAVSVAQFIDNSSPTGQRNTVWLSIIISSWLFAVFHANIGHWPALFVLAVCLGYAYEKSGSLFRPIFIHCLFNAITIIAVLNQ